MCIRDRVYGDAPQPRGADGRWGGLTEDSPTGRGIKSAYGKSMFMVEQILEDLHQSPAGKQWGIIILRYSNPVAAHPSGRIGEDPTRPPNNVGGWPACCSLSAAAPLVVFLCFFYHSFGGCRR